MSRVSYTTCHPSLLVTTEVMTVNISRVSWLGLDQKCILVDKKEKKSDWRKFSIILLLISAIV